MKKIYFVLALVIGSCSSGNDSISFESTKSKFPEIEKINIDIEQLQKSFGVKYHPQRDSFNLDVITKTELKSLLVHDSTMHGSRFFYYGRLSNKNFDMLIYLKNDTSSIKIIDKYIACTFDKESANLISKIELASIISPYPEEVTQTICVNKSGELHQTYTHKEYDDLTEEPSKLITKSSIINIDQSGRMIKKDG